MPRKNTAILAPALAPDTTYERDDLVPDPQVWREFGVSSMALWRWTHDPKLGFPPPVKIRGRNFRSRRALEAWKARAIRNATALRTGGGNEAA